MSEETTPEVVQEPSEDAAQIAAQETAAANQVESDGVVEARWSVAVLPKRNVSIQFRVAPTGDGKAVTSVTASFVEMKDGIVMDTFAGTTVNALIDAKDGQGLTGDMGADFTVFANRGFGQVAAVLAGIVHTDEGPRNFFFWRPIDPAT
jgi:hypothetical protein